MPISDQPPAIIEIVDIKYDPGGNLDEQLTKWKAYRDRGTQVRINGVCGSGCTLVTRLPENNVCVTMLARLVFHEAHFKNGTSNWLATKYLTDQYPSWVRAWIANTGQHVLGPGYMVMGPAELTKHYAVCSNDTIAQK